MTQKKQHVVVVTDRADRLPADRDVLKRCEADLIVDLQNRPKGTTVDIAPSPVITLAVAANAVLQAEAVGLDHLDVGITVAVSPTQFASGRAWDQVPAAKALCERIYAKAPRREPTPAIRNRIGEVEWVATLRQMRDAQFEEATDLLVVWDPEVRQGPGVMAFRLALTLEMHVTIIRPALSPIPRMTPAEALAWGTKRGIDPWRPDGQVDEQADSTFAAFLTL